MASYSKLVLSGSTNGRQIKVVATTSPGTSVHTGVSGTSNFDEIWLYVTNNHTASVNLTIEFGGTTSPDDLIQLSVPSKTGLYLVVPGLIIQNGLAVRAFASVTNVLSISGWINRITA